MRVGYWMQGQAISWVEQQPPRRIELLRSVAYTCPHCGEIWARVIVPAEGWTVIERDCRGSLLEDVHGQVYFNYNPHFFPGFLVVEAIPEAWVKREFELELKGGLDAR